MLVNGVYFCDRCHRSVPTIEAKAWILQYGPAAQLLCIYCQRGQVVVPVQPPAYAPQQYDYYGRPPGPPPRAAPPRGGRYGGDRGGYAEEYDDEEPERPRRPVRRVGTGSKMGMGLGLGLLVLGGLALTIGYFFAFDDIAKEMKAKQIEADAIDVRIQAPAVGDDPKQLQLQWNALDQGIKERNLHQKSMAATRPVPLAGVGLALAGVVIMIISSMTAGRGGGAVRSRGRLGRERER